MNEPEQLNCMEEDQRCPDQARGWPYHNAECGQGQIGRATGQQLTAGLAWLYSDKVGQRQAGKAVLQTVDQGPALVNKTQWSSEKCIFKCGRSETGPGSIFSLESDPDLTSHKQNVNNAKFEIQHT